MTLYPLKFQPIFHYRMWGGEKLKTVLHKSYTEHAIGESWEISDVPGNKSVIINGDLKGKTLSEIITTYGAAILGNKVAAQFGNEFPLLLKFIDAKTPLSIQVHPNDEIAKKRANSFGKNEMWYVMEADEDAELIVGFKDKENKETYQKAIEDGNILSKLNALRVTAGDTFYIPAGRVHAIGAGVLIAEIQQTSDITYRIYDYDRVDAKTNKKRQMHTEESVDVIDFEVLDNYKTSYAQSLNDSSKLVHSPYFKTNFVKLNGNLPKLYVNTDSFVIYMCVAGDFTLNYGHKDYSLRMGEVILLPASVDEVQLSGNASFIEIYL